MSKSNEIQKGEFIVTVDSWYKSAGTYYDEGLKLEKIKGDQGKIDSHYRLAAAYFWDALVLGHPKAAYSLALCFYYGIGVKEDEHIAKLFFGVALALNDERCQKEQDNFQIPEKMNKAIADLTKLVKYTHSTINIHDKLDEQKLLDNLQLFDKSIKLPHMPEGQKVTTLFMAKDQEASQVADIPQNQNITYHNDNAHQSTTDHTDHRQHDDTQVTGNHPAASNCCCAIF